MKANNASIVAKLIAEMGADNNVTFIVKPKQQKALENAVQQMRDAGCRFTPTVICSITCGEGSAMEKTYSKYNGWKLLDRTLTEVFDQY